MPTVSSGGAGQVKQGKRRKVAQRGGGPVLAFTAEEWSAFVQGVKDGTFDLP